PFAIPAASCAEAPIGNRAEETRGFVLGADPLQIHRQLALEALVLGAAVRPRLAFEIAPQAGRIHVRTGQKHRLLEAGIAREYAHRRPPFGELRLENLLR